jgi:putative cell wall-binding protein
LAGALLAALIPLAALPAAAAVPVTYWVDVATGVDTNPGTEALPFKTITKAADVAGSLDTIMVRPGVYSTVSGEQFDIWLAGASLKSTGGPDVTIIQGDGTTKLIGQQGGAEGDVNSGFTFTNGHGGSGGALGLYLSVPTGPGWPCIENNVFEDNTAIGNQGGAIYLYVGTNTPGRYPLIRDNVFINNSAASGGAIAVDNAICPIITRNHFSENHATGGGGAIKITTVGAWSAVGDNMFSGNEAGSSGGGALYYSVSGGATHHITGNSFDANWSGGRGGAMWLYGTTANVSGNYATCNAATMEGGFAYLEYSAVTAWNNLIYGGSAGHAAAWYVNSAMLREVNDTVANNAPGLVATYANTIDTLLISNSIYWNPDMAITEIQGADVIADCCISDPDIGNLTYGNSGIQDCIFSDPKFVNTTTPPIDARIKPTSPCIDKGTDAEAVPDEDHFGSPRPVDGNRDGLTRYDIGFHEYQGVVRIAGPNRYATSVAASKRGFPDGAATVVIATGENWPDALGGSALAGAVGGPLLLTRTTSLPAEVANEIKRLGATKAYILGSTASVSAGVASAIDALPLITKVTRLGGANRYETARKVADETIRLLGSDFGKQAFVATGSNYPDAVAASPIAAWRGMPILLANINAGTVSVPPAVTDVIILGSDLAVPTAVETYLEGVVADVDRIGGRNRYDTAAQIAEFGVGVGMTWDGVGLSTGLNFPDALAAGPMLATRDSVLLLTRPDVLSGEAKAKLQANAASILSTFIFGDINAVSAAVEQSAKAAAGL